MGGAFAFPWHLARAEGVPNEYDGSKFQLKAPEPNPKSGGVLRYAITSRPPHFDVHQSGTINSLGSQGCMFDNLVRRDPRDSGKTIIPISPTAGRSPRTARPIRSTCARACSSMTARSSRGGRQGDLRPHRQAAGRRQHSAQPLFRAVSEINAPDKNTVEFKLSERRARPTS